MAVHVGFAGTVLSERILEMKKQTSFEKAKSAKNLQLILVGILVTLLPMLSAAFAIPTLLTYAEQPEEVTFEDDWDWGEDVVDNTDESFGGFEPDLDSDFQIYESTSPEVVDVPDVSVDDAYDYDVNSAASFDASFVDGDSSESGTPANDGSPESLFNDVWNVYANHETKSVMNHCVFSEYGNTDIEDFKAKLSQSLDSETYEAGVHYGESGIQWTLDNYDQSCVVIYTDIETQKLHIECWGYDTAESWCECSDNVLIMTMFQSFSDHVGDLIDNSTVEVLLSSAPKIVTDDMTARRVFNIFDDKVTATTSTRVTDWIDFYDQYEQWEIGLSEHSIGFVCYNNKVTNTREYAAIAYDTNGDELSTTVYKTELVA